MSQYSPSSLALFATDSWERGGLVVVSDSEARSRGTIPTSAVLCP